MKTRRGVWWAVGGAVLAGTGWLAWGQWPLPVKSASPASRVEEIIQAARAEAALEPVVGKRLPVFAPEGSGPAGTYWMLEADVPPHPFDPFPELMVYLLGEGHWLVDDRSVDYPALNRWLAAVSGLGRPGLPDGGDGGAMT